MTRRTTMGGVSALTSLSCIALSTLLSVGISGVADAAPRVAAANPDQLFGVHPVLLGSTTLPGGHFNFALVPGQTITDGVVIENFSDHALTFHVYGADLLTAVGGGLAPAQPTTTMREVGAWIAVSVPTLTIAAHGQRTDRFVVRMPAIVTSGQHLGAVVVAADVGTTAEGSPIEARLALITVVTVPGVAHTSGRLTPLIVSIAGSGQLRFRVALVNTGNMLLTYTGSVAITDAGGHTMATLALSPSGAYVVPGGEVPLAGLLESSALPVGSYRARATVAILADGTPVGILASQSVTVQVTSGVPTLAIIVGAFAAVAIVALATTYNRRRTRVRRLARPRAGRAKLSGVG
jgi:WxL interacting protein linking bacterial and host surfaces